MTDAERRDRIDELEEQLARLRAGLDPKK